MKKVISIAAIVLFVVISYLVGYKIAKNKFLLKEKEMEGITFEYFYRGFTPLTDDVDIDSLTEMISEPKIITSKEAFYDFCNQYCPVAAVFSIENVNFETDVFLIDGSIYGSRASENATRNIEKIIVDSDNVNIIYYQNVPYSETVYASNFDGIGHAFIQLVRVKKADLMPALHNN